MKKTKKLQQAITLSACILAAAFSIASGTTISIQAAHASDSDTASMQDAHASGCDTASMQDAHASGCDTASMQDAHASGCDTASMQDAHASGCDYMSGQAVFSTQLYPKDLGFPASDDLFAEYADHVFYNSRSTASLKNLNAASKLKGQNKTIYNFLKSEIAEAADGTRTSTEFPIAVSSLLDKMSYSSSELGLSAYSSKEEIADAIEHKIFDFSFYTVMNALFADCPYELYWLSRFESIIQSGPEYILDADNGISFADDACIIFQFPVDSPYAAGTYRTDTSKTRAAANAAANAKSIINDAAGMSDYEKLAYYCQQICRLTSYNDAAAAGAMYDSRPLQMIYVFDEDPSTSVVCEGYAKAFQYLCDMTTFSNKNIYCCTVDGTMKSSSSTGPHMWNIVHMGSIGNYLVDVTNCDTGSIGAENNLFLTGYTSGSVQGGYTVQIPGQTRTEGSLILTRPEVSVTYQYHEDMYSLYTSEELTLAQGSTLNPELIRDNETHLHAYEADFTWSADDSRCSVSIICRTNPAHSALSLTCSVTSQVIVPATCTAKGTTAYTAHASYDGREFNDSRQRQDIAINPSNHTGSTRIQGAQAASSTQDGYTGDTYCRDCGALISKGSIIPAAGSQDSTDNTNPGDSDSTSTGPDRNPDETEDASEKKILDSISAKKSSAAIKKGQSIRFLLNSSLDMKHVKKITYRSSKKSVAKVSKTGKITGKKAGTATIKAKVTLKNGMNKTVSMKIKVKAKI